MIPHNRPSISNLDTESVTKSLLSRQLAAHSKVNDFELMFTNFLGNCGNSISTSSGTAALYLALYAIGIKENNEVIIPTYTCSSILNAIFMHKAKPVLIDIDPLTWNLDYSQVEKACNKKTKAIIVTHTFGNPCDLNLFKSLGIPIIEDCAQSLGSLVNNQKTGTLADISTFSFYATKFITTGEGGMVFSKKRDLVEKIRDYINFDYRQNYYPRFNFKLTDFQAALGISQLERISIFLRKREKISTKYKKNLSKKIIRWQLVQNSKCKANNFRCIALVDNPKKIISHLKKNNINAIIPIEKFELLNKYLNLKNKTFPIAEYISEHTISLPIYPDLREKDIREIISCFLSLN